MTIRPIHAIAAMALMALATSCDNSSDIGASLTGDNVEIVVDSTFTVSGTTVEVNKIIPKTTVQMLGSINVPEFGSLSSNVVTQFLPSTQLDTENFTSENVDSIFLTLRYPLDGFIGDSLVPMGLKVYPLVKQIEVGIGSDFDPAGYYDPTPIGSLVYNAASYNRPSASQSYRQLDVKLPTELGRRLFKTYEEHPAYYADGQVFAEDVFPGIYIESSFGSGRLTQVSITAMTMNLRKIAFNEETEKNDTTDAVHQYFLVTPEVVSNNNLKVELAQSLKDMKADGKNLLVAPQGYEMEIEFPARQIAENYKAKTRGLGVINTLTFSLPVDSIENGHAVTPPPYLLMVLKKDREEFFAKNKLPDNLTSFYATYDATNSRYLFSGLRNYISDIIAADEIKPEDYTFSLVPVQVNFESVVSNYYSSSTSSTETEVLPYLLSPAMGIVKLEDAKIKFTYSLQSQK